MVVLLPSVRTEDAAVIAPVQGTHSQSLQARRIYVVGTDFRACGYVIA